MNSHELKRRLRSAIETAPSPYDAVAGGVYLQRAWERGAEYAVEQCVALWSETEFDAEPEAKVIKPRVWFDKLCSKFTRK